MMDTRLFLDGKVFRSVANTANGEVDGQTVFRYSQSGNIVTAVYSGGAIVQGQLSGACRSVPTLLPGGRIRYDEMWQWLCDDRSTGRSVIEEVPQP